MSVARSANEIEALVLRAARGGGLPLGFAEDLAAATAYLDLDALSECPCQPSGGAFEIPPAIDAVLALRTPQAVRVQSILVAAYCAATSEQTGKTLGFQTHRDCATVEPDGDSDLPPRLGRRVIPAALEAHLMEMAAKILVPESDASRAAGAGAGLTDND